MEILRFGLLVVIGGLIGWITNKVAIKMLFRPVNPHRILGITFQGVFPRRKDQIAISLADIIETELLSKEVIMDQILKEERLDALKEKLQKVLIDKLVDTIPSIASMFLGGDVRAFVTKYVDKNSDDIFDSMVDELKAVGIENLDVHSLVKERIDSLDFIEFEKIIFGLMSKELRFVEIIGLFLGAFIGVLQYLIVTFI